MKKLKIYQVDAFTDELFKGNPAAVCPLDEWLDDELMQSIAAENNLAETAFFVRVKDKFELRWFTPAVEVDLCGHATLASAYVLFNQLGYKGEEISFQSIRSGELKVSRNKDMLTLNFPADTYSRAVVSTVLAQALRATPSEYYKGSYYLAVFDSEEEILSIQPDFQAIADLKVGGLIITAPGKDVDFVSRFFAPEFGINEDPVTGSAHTLLTPFWSNRMKKKKMVAKQLSNRGGTLYCEDSGERIKIGGKAQLYMIGEIIIS